VGPSKLIQAEAEANTTDGNWHPQDSLTPGRNQGKINVPTAIRKGTDRMNVPNGPGILKGPPRLGQRSGCSGKVLAHLQGSQPLGGTLSHWQPWKAMRRTRTDKAPFY
jgi:hypothetical protein